MPREFKPQAFSYGPDDEGLIEAAKAKATRMRMSFSAYIVSLIERDVLDQKASIHQAELKKGKTKNVA